MIKIEYRVEKKYTVSNIDLKVLESRLENIMDSDIHQIGEGYTVRSLYFDDINNSCMESNEKGVNYRKKYRIRTYGGDNSPIKIEIKEKINGFNKKYTSIISKEEFKSILDGEITEFDAERPALNEFFLQMRSKNLSPAVIIEYDRTAFVCDSGNVRVTFDRNVKASRDFESFLEDEISDYVNVLPSGKQILEVKYDEFLPDIIAKQLELKKLRLTAFSKYYFGRRATDF